MRHLLPLFLALVSITANATPNVQSIEAAAFAAGSNQVPIIAIIPGESGVPGNAETQSDKAGAANAALVMGMQVPAVVAVIGVPGAKAPAPVLDTGFIGVQLRPPQGLVNTPERQGAAHPGQLARVHGRGRGGHPQRLVRGPGQGQQQYG